MMSIAVVIFTSCCKLTAQCNRNVLLPSHSSQKNPDGFPNNLSCRRERECKLLFFQIPVNCFKVEGTSIN